MTKPINIELQYRQRLAGEPLIDLHTVTSGDYHSTILRIVDWSVFFEVRSR